MAILTRGPRGMGTQRRKQKQKRKTKAGPFGPSVREVTLLGTARPGAPWAPGSRLEWRGRTYLVEATEPDAGGGPPRYVHLTTNAEAGVEDGA